MSWKPEEVLVICNHHRYLPVFKDTIRHLWHAGFRNIWIQETGNGSWGWFDGYSRWTQRSGEISYDIGMVRFKNIISSAVPGNALFFIDCDCFISDIAPLHRFISDFEAGGYAYSCHHPLASAYSPDYVYNGCIAPIKSQKFFPSPDFPGFYPEPHWENTYALMNRHTWDGLQPQDMPHTRMWLRRIHELGGKFGAHHANYRLQYTHFGDGWFHFGNLMAFLYAVERGDESKFQVNSETEMSRLGFLQWQERVYGNETYPHPIRENLHRLLIGKEKIAEEAWGQLSSGTCMENWTRAGR
jgi:hypothetical protein